MNCTWTDSTATGLYLSQGGGGEGGWAAVGAGGWGAVGGDGGGLGAAAPVVKVNRSSNKSSRSNSRSPIRPNHRH